MPTKKINAMEIDSSVADLANRVRPGRKGAGPAARQHEPYLTYDVLGGLLPADVEARNAAELTRTRREIDELDTDPP